MSRTLITRWLMPPGVIASSGAVGTIGVVPSAIVLLQRKRIAAWNEYNVAPDVLPIAEADQRDCLDGHGNASAKARAVSSVAPTRRSCGYRSRNATMMSRRWLSSNTDGRHALYPATLPYNRMSLTTEST